MGFCMKTRRGHGSNRSVIPMPFETSCECEALDKMNFKITGGGRIRFLRDATLTVRCVPASNDPDAAGNIYRGVSVLASSTDCFIRTGLAGLDDVFAGQTNAFLWRGYGSGDGDINATYPGYVILSLEG